MDKGQVCKFASLQVCKAARRVIGHWPLVIFLGFLALYTATLMPDVLPEDSGEFQLVAASAGVAHPPGYPLHTILGWLFTHLPLGPHPAWRVNLFSAVTAAATATLVFQTARRMSGSTWGGLAAALALGSATTFWATATKASIRPLTAFFTAACLYSLVEHGKRTADCRLQIADCRSPSDRYLVVFALALSLGLTHHPASFLFSAPILIAYLVLADPALLRRPHRWLRPAAAFVLGLLVLAYLPLRSAAGATLAPSDLTTPSGFLRHFLGLGFQGDMFALNPFDRLAILPTLLRFQFNPLLLLAALLGALLLLRHDRKLALLLVGSFLVTTTITLTYRAPQTVEYLTPAYVALALLVAVPCGRISRIKSRIRESASLRVGRVAFLVICHLLLVMILVAGIANLAAHLPSYVMLSRSRDARDYAETLLRDAPEDAIILSNWHWSMPLRYLKEIEGLRPDVAVKYVAPQGHSLARNWVDAIEEHLPQRPVVVTQYYEAEYGQLPYRFESFGEAFLVRDAPNFDLPAGLAPLDVTLDEQVALRGYRLEAEETEPSRPLALTLAWSPVAAPAANLSLFAQLVGHDGRLWSTARDRAHPAGRLAAGEVVVERFVVTPLLQAAPGDYALVVGAYGPGGPRLTTAGGADSVQLATVHLRPSTVQPVTNHATLVHFAGGPTLTGADYDAGLPGRVRAYLHWAGPGAEASLHLLDGGGTVVGRGSVPALGPGRYATTAFDLATTPAQVALLDGDRPRRWNLLFAGSAPLPAVRPGERYVPFGDALVLTGFDGPAGPLEPGADVTLGLHFVGARPLERDYIVSAALVGLNPDRTWVWRAADDGVPASGAVPTLKWILGSAVYDPHRLAVPGDAPTVPVEGYLVIYDHFTQAPLLPLDERSGPFAPLGSWPAASP